MRGECGAPACRNFKSLVSVPKPLFLMIARSPLMFQLSMRIGVLCSGAAYAKLLERSDSFVFLLALAQLNNTFVGHGPQSQNPDEGEGPSTSSHKRAEKT